MLDSEVAFDDREKSGGKSMKPHDPTMKIKVTDLVPKIPPQLRMGCKSLSREGTIVPQQIGLELMEELVESFRWVGEK